MIRTHVASNTKVDIDQEILRWEPMTRKARIRKERTYTARDHSNEPQKKWGCHKSRRMIGNKERSKNQHQRLSKQTYRTKQKHCLKQCQKREVIQREHRKNIERTKWYHMHRVGHIQSERVGVWIIEPMCAGIEFTTYELTQDQVLWPKDVNTNRRYGC